MRAPSPCHLHNRPPVWRSIGSKLCQNSACHNLLMGKGFFRIRGRTRPGRAAASGRKPQGSLDGWCRCKTIEREEWQASASSSSFPFGCEFALPHGRQSPRGSSATRGRSRSQSAVIFSFGRELVVTATQTPLGCPGDRLGFFVQRPLLPFGQSGDPGFMLVSPHPTRKHYQDRQGAPPTLDHGSRLGCLWSTRWRPIRCSPSTVGDG